MTLAPRAGASVTLGQDVAGDNQPLAKMRYPAWAAGGVRFGWVEFVRGTKVIPDAGAHLAAMRAAGYRAAGYINIHHGDTAAQMRTFLGLAPAPDLPDMLDAEESTLTESDLRAACDEHDRSGREMVIYTNYWAWLAIVPPAARPHYKKYRVVIASYPHDTPAGQPVPMDPASVARRSTPPAVFDPPVPAPWTVADVFSHQYTGQGSREDYDGFLDLHLLNPAVEISGAPMPTPTTNRGCLLGGHTQGNSSIIPIYAAIQARAKAQGKTARLKFIISDEDGGKMIEGVALGVETRINRKHLPEQGPNHWMEGGGDANVPLTPQQKQDFINTAKALPYKASPTEFKDTSYFQVMGNEWERNTAQGWVDYLDLCLQVIIQGQQLGVHDKAMLMGITDAEAATLGPVHYDIPVFNAGSPRANLSTATEMYDAIAAHPIWQVAQDDDHLLFCHEGITFDAPFTDGENTPIEPGAELPPGAGTENFRIFNLLERLWRRGIRVKWGVGEWYDGRRPRDHQIAERVANMIRHDNLLAASPFAADCVGYGQYQFDNNPKSPWYEQDCTLLWETDAWQQHVIDVSERINGGDEMQPIFHGKAQQDLAIRDLQGNYASAPVGAPPAAAGLGGVVKKDTLLHIYQTGVTLPNGLKDRVVITPDGLNVWGVPAAVVKV